MYAISINNKTADEKIRGALSIPDEERSEFLHRIAGGRDAVAVCTCNRTEIYGEDSISEAFDQLALQSGLDVSLIRDHSLVFTDEEAIRHLFRVCAGLDSMVIGEDEILGQVKNAAKAAKAAGTYDDTFPQIFQAAFAAAKKVKTDTLLSKTSVSIATICASYCHKFFDGEKSVLMIGAGGDIGSSLRKDLLSYGDCHISATVHRTRFDERGIKTIDYHDRYNGIGDCDIIISATKSPHFTVTKNRFLEQPHTEKKRLFVDLAVPSDIDPEVRKIPGAELVTIDDFRRLAKENNEKKATAAEAAEDILSEEEETLFKELYVKKILPLLPGLSEKYGSGFKKFFFEYKKAAGAGEFRQFADTIERLDR